MYAKGHHGYPQPEDTWGIDCFEAACLRCGRHGNQIAPLRIKQSKAVHSGVIQLNWLFDAFLIHPQLLDLLVNSGLRGIGSMQVINHKTNAAIDDRVQLCVPNVISCVETSLLPKATCCPNNEESKLVMSSGPTRYPSSSPFCSSVKSHPPTKVSIRSTAVVDAPDIFLSDEWFGSGERAFRLTLCSDRLVQIFAEQRIRGVSFKPVLLDDVSTRDIQLGAVEVERLL
jgi:hypothetical protein